MESANNTLALLKALPLLALIAGCGGPPSNTDAERDRKNITSEPLPGGNVVVVTSVTEPGSKPEGVLVPVSEPEETTSSIPAEKLASVANQLAHLEKLAASPIPVAAKSVEAGFDQCLNTIFGIQNLPNRHSVDSALAESIKESTHDSLSHIRQAIDRTEPVAEVRAAYDAGIARLMESIEAF